MIFDEKHKTADGRWLACNQMEQAAEATLKHHLSQFEPAIRDCYEAGVQVPTLTSKRCGAPDIRLAALFLKKALNDLRAVWRLTCLGYTSQAAAIAATLYENALAASCLAGNADLAAHFRKQKNGDLPWKPQALAKLLASRWQEEARKAENSFSKEEFELAWREVYSAYKWLCKIKHPTFLSALHDSMATSTKAGEFVVMAAPDLRQEDLPVKATILTIAISRIREAIHCFATGAECDETCHHFDSFKTKMENILTTTKKAYEIVRSHPLPFDIRDSDLTETYSKLRERAGRAN
jgi:hypothetical protein